jgi:hypothetical protein
MLKIRDMKKTTLSFVILLLVCSCQKAIQDKKDAEATFSYFEIEDCDDCEDLDPESCCCEIKRVSGGDPVELDICGTTSPTSGSTICMLGTPPAPCDSYDYGGVREEPSFLQINDNYLFCAGKDQVIRIRNTTAFSADFQIICNTVLSPLAITIPGLSFVDILIDSDCEAMECD